MQVDEIVSREEMARRLVRNDLYDANEWLVGKPGTGSPLNLHRDLAPDLARELRFISKNAESLTFKPGSDYLDEQTLRIPRAVSPRSARLLDEIINVTDDLPQDNSPITVSRYLLDQWSFRLPEEVAVSDIHEEGSVKQILVNRFERDVRARSACLNHYGATCKVCDNDLASQYGQAASGLIHVHHLAPLANTGITYRVDPIKDLRPVCPNCRAVIHRRDPPYSIEEIQKFISANRQDRQS
jgi:hypothetical protein